MTYHPRLFSSPFTHIFHFINPLPPSILDTDNLSTSLLRCSSLFIAMTFLVFLFISSSSLFVHFTIPASYLITETAHVFTAIILFLPLSLIFMINFVLFKHSLLLLQMTLLSLFSIQVHRTFLFQIPSQYHYLIFVLWKPIHLFHAHCLQRYLNHP